MEPEIPLSFASQETDAKLVSRLVRNPGLALLAAAVFLSSLLLFLIQPIVAKAILPRFGGSAGVWTTCMFFFQAVLLLGYAYAHFLTGRLPASAQRIGHVTLLSCGALTLPVTLSQHWISVEISPILHILAVLVSSIGLPYFALSATSPLMQNWIGGLLGSVFVGLAAPLAFNSYLELPLSMAACLMLALALLYGQSARRLLRLGLLALAAFMVSVSLEEAFELYLRHLAPGGVIAVHATSKYTDLAPVVYRVAASLGRNTQTVTTQADLPRRVMASTWIISRGEWPVESNEHAWRDDYSNPIEILKF